MLSLLEPSPERIQAVLKAAAGAPLSYSPEGMTRGEAVPPGYDVDRYRTCLGTGEATFDRAKRAIGEWRMSRLSWAAIQPADAPIDPGSVVAMKAHAFGFWTCSPCRVIYRVDDEAADPPRRRFGFAYGTLPGHVEKGEELFLTEWDTASDRVHFEIVAVSRPRHPLVRLAYPLTRRAQRRFGRDALAAMHRAVGDEGRRG